MSLFTKKDGPKIARMLILLSMCIINSLGLWFQFKHSDRKKIKIIGHIVYFIPFYWIILYTEAISSMMSTNISIPFKKMFSFKNSLWSCNNTGKNKFYNHYWNSLKISLWLNQWFLISSDRLPQSSAWLGQIPNCLCPAPRVLGLCRNSKTRLDSFLPNWEYWW